MVADWAEYYELDVSNRRRAPRVRSDLDVAFCTESGESGQCVAINLSRTGARVVTGSPKMSRGEFTLRIGPKVQVLARAVWESPGPGGRSWVAGLHFTSISSSQQAELDRFLGDLQLSA